MDRLYFVMRAALVAAFLFSCLPACGDDGTTVAPPSRVIAVAADPNAGPSVEDFCDVAGAGTNAPELSFPELAGPTPAVGGATRWVNVWATWCAPCVEEIPRIVGFAEQLDGDGVAVDLVFLSADRDDAAVDGFREQHPGTPSGPRIADPATLPAWAASVGLDEGATLPIHVFADRDGRVRCARTGGIGDEHYDVIKAILAR